MPAHGVGTAWVRGSVTRSPPYFEGSLLKNLGVTFDRFLSWDSHVSKLSQKCCGILTGISHLRQYLPSGTIPILVSALVLSHIRYCLTVYGNGSAKNLAVIDKILNFAARVISGKRKFDHISAVRESLGWLIPSAMVLHQSLSSEHAPQGPLY